MTSFAASRSHSAGGLPRDYTAPSVFEPDALIREARRQKHILVADVPRVCVLDPDGDIVRHLSRAGRTRPVPQWPCYHSRMVETDLDGHSVGIVDCAVGAPYAVLVAEQMFALGCELLLSITSSGQVAPLGPTPYFVLIDRALRDEGTSHHYAPPAEFADADATLVPTAEHALAATGFRVHRGATWTTDAPFRETSAAIAAARAKGILAVEMEAAALYAFAQSRSVRVLCFAHVTAWAKTSTSRRAKLKVRPRRCASSLSSLPPWRPYEMEAQTPNRSR